MATCVLPGGSALNYRIDFAGAEAPWVVFGNSLMTDLSIWDDQVAALAGRFNLLRYDQRGHGASAIPSAAINFEQLGQDLLAVMDAAGVTRCSYVGLSMGVPTGLAAYAVRPQAFARLVLVDGQARSAATGQAFWAERIAFAREHGMGLLAEQTVRRWLRPSRHGLPMADRLGAMIAATPSAGFIVCAGVLRSYDLSALLDRIDVPVHLVAGAEDGAMPATMAAMKDVIAGATFTTIEDAGHIPNFERPEVFNVILEQALLAEPENRP